MINNLILCTNAILPVFLLVFVGVFIKKIKLVDDNFAKKAISLVFNVSLPATLFLDIYRVDIAEKFDAKLVFFAAGATFLFFILSVIVSGAIKDAAKRASFAQGVFRSNYAILGVPLTKAIFPAEVAVNASVLLSVTIPLYNVLAVILLTSLLNKKKNLGTVFSGIIKNPLIIGAVAGAVFSLLHIPLPEVLVKPLGYLSDMSTPLSLIVIGASFTWSAARDTFAPSVIASSLKTIVSPLVFVPAAAAFGISGGALGVLFIFFAAPAAISSYTMARNMGGDYQMAGNIVLISTAMSFFVIFFGILFMKTLGIF